MRLLSVVFLVLFNLVNAQATWEKIYSDDASTILLNSAKIIGYGNEVSVWAIEEFNEPKSSENGGEVSKTKTHYLFNKMKRKYAEVGVIYYDSHGKILNRSSKSNFQGSSSAFMTPIKSNPSVEIIYKEAVSFLITGNIRTIDENESSSQSEVATASTESVEDANDNEDESSSEEESQNNEEADFIAEVGVVSEAEEENNEVEATEITTSTEDIDLSKEPWNEIPKIAKSGNIEEKPEIKSLSSNELREFEKIKIDIPLTTKEPVQKYDQENERALANAIFTDGNLYCIQVSSWKTRAYADRELKKLLSDGFDAFIVSVKPANKRSIWNRVRVGYFSTLKEAKAIQKKIGRR
jgi:cell division protein FtsN